MDVSRDAEPMDVLDAADLFGDLVDENGYMPGDEDFQGVEPEETTEEVVEEEETTEEEDEAEDEDEGGSEESDEDESEDESDEGEEKLIEIQIGDEIYEVNEEELKAGYLRNEALVARTTELETQYNQRFQEVAEKEVQVLAELDALLMLQNADAAKFRNVNWQELKTLDPEKYSELRLEYLDAQEKQQVLSERKAQLQSLHQQAERIKHEAHLREQHSIALKLLPELEKPEFQQELVSYGKELGFTEDEVRGIADARQLVLLNQARLYARSQLRRKEALEQKVPKGVPKVTKPGAPQATGQVKAKQTRAAAEGLKKSGGIRDAANFFLTADLV